MQLTPSTLYKMVMVMISTFVKYGLVFFILDLYVQLIQYNQ